LQVRIGAEDSSAPDGDVFSASRAAGRPRHDRAKQVEPPSSQASGPPRARAPSAVRRRHLVQRFGDALNLNVHFHSLVLDGVYASDAEGSLRFHPLPPPEDAEVEHVCVDRGTGRHGQPRWPAHAARARSHRGRTPSGLGRGALRPRSRSCSRWWSSDRSPGTGVRTGRRACSFSRCT